MRARPCPTSLGIALATLNEIDSDFPRPFLAIQNVRNLKKGKSYKCESVYESKFNLLFSKEDIITGKLIKCI